MKARGSSIPPWLALCAGFTTACTSTPRRPPTEDAARQMTPVPACLTSLDRAGAGVAVALKDEYWRIVFPEFDQGAHALSPKALSCTGRALLKEPEFTDLLLQPNLDEVRITRSSRVDDLRLVWLRSHDNLDGATAGALALVKVSGNLAEAIGVGVYRGRPSAKLSIDRLGNERVAVVLDEGCQGVGPDKPCKSTQTVYFIRQGRLVQAAKFAREQVDFLASSEPAISGQLRYHLTAAPTFARESLNVVERITIADSSGREIRWAEVERRFLPVEDTLEADDTSLWSRVYNATAKLP